MKKYVKESEYENDVNKLWEDSCSGILKALESACESERERGGGETHGGIQR